MKLGRYKQVYQPTRQGFAPKYSCMTLGSYLRYICWQTSNKGTWTMGAASSAAEAAGVSYQRFVAVRNV